MLDDYIRRVLHTVTFAFTCVKWKWYPGIHSLSGHYCSQESPWATLEFIFPIHTGITTNVNGLILLTAVYITPMQANPDCMILENLWLKFSFLTRTPNGTCQAGCRIALKTLKLHFLFCQILPDWCSKPVLLPKALSAVLFSTTAMPTRVSPVFTSSLLLHSLTHFNSESTLPGN